MNPLSEHGHLFANGEFRATATFKDDEIPKEDWFIEQGLITGYDPIADNICISDEGWCKVWYAKLIARPIESLTDEEVFELFPHIKPAFTADDYREILRQKARDDELQLKEARKLADKGVYFGPQDHFGDTVIDTRTLKTNEV